MRQDKQPTDETRRERIARARRFFVPQSPAIAAKSDDLESLKKTVEDAASVGAALWFSYIFVLFYIAIAAGGVTHVDLLLERAVKLPFLNVELPLTAFFFLAPIIFVIVHVYVLTHFVLLGRKAKRFHEELLNQIPDRDPEDNGAANKRDKLRGQLPSNIFVQFLAGPRDVRDSAFGFLLRIIAYVTLVIGPLALLLLIQIKFLPYHNIYITWAQRIFLIVDLAMIRWLWRDIISGRGDYRPLFNRKNWRKSLISAFTSFTIILFSFCVATLPEETLPAGPALFPSKLFWIISPNQTTTSHLPEYLTLRSALFEGPIDCIKRRRQSFLSNTLILTGIDLNKELKTDNSKIVDLQTYSFVLRGRNLDHAIMDIANLQKIDFSGANLIEASFREANLEGTNIGFAHLEGASLDSAHLEGASLDHAHLEGASLDFAHLEGASLDYAHLEGASLEWANLDAASLDSIHLEGAYLSESNLEASYLKDANLQGAVLSSIGDANLNAANLSDAWLWRTSLPKKKK